MQLSNDATHRTVRRHHCTRQATVLIVLCSRDGSAPCSWADVHRCSDEGSAERRAAEYNDCKRPLRIRYRESRRRRAEACRAIDVNRWTDAALYHPYWLHWPDPASVVITDDERASRCLDGVLWSHAVQQLNTSEFIAAGVELHQLVGVAWRHEQASWCHRQFSWFERLQRRFWQPELYVSAVCRHSPHTLQEVGDIQLRGLLAGDDVTWRS